LRCVQPLKTTRRRNGSIQGATGLPQLSDLSRHYPGTFCTTLSWRARGRFERVTLPFRPQLFPQSALPTSGHRTNPRSGAILILPIQNWSSFHCWMECGRILSLAQRWTCLLEHWHLSQHLQRTPKLPRLHRSPMQLTTGAIAFSFSQKCCSNCPCRLWILASDPRPYLAVSA